MLKRCYYRGEGTIWYPMRGEAMRFPATGSWAATTQSAEDTQALMAATEHMTFAADGFNTMWQHWQPAERNVSEGSKCSFMGYLCITVTYLASYYSVKVWTPWSIFLLL